MNKESYKTKRLVELSTDDRVTAFFHEIVYPMIFDAFDDEEKNLMTAMGELYLEDALTVYVIRKGVRFYVGDAKKFVGDRDKPELDAELNETIDRRLNEDREFELSERSFLNIGEWKQLRGFLDAAQTRSPATDETPSADSPTSDSILGQKRIDARSHRLLLGSEIADCVEQIVVQQKKEQPPQSPDLPDPEQPDLPPAESIDVDENELEHRVEEQLKLKPADINPICEHVNGDWQRFHREFAAFGEHCLEGEAAGIAVVPKFEESAEVWFAGDVHGDLLGLEAVFQIFKKEAKKGAKLVFLGDLIDRGLNDVQVITSLLHRMYEERGVYGWLAGNHDEGLVFNKDSKEFWSSVSPATFENELNQREDDEFTRFGTRVINIVENLPRALFLPDLLAAHGGFPHSDLWPGIHKFVDLGHKDCLGDFVWNRWSDSRYKVPNRSRSGSQFGADDFQGFREVCKEQLGHPIEAMVRGHDHIHENQARWERKEAVPRGSYYGRILTINTISHNQRGDHLSRYTQPNPRFPTLARWRAGEILPTPVEVHLPLKLVQWYAPSCPNSDCRTVNKTDADKCEECGAALDS